MRDRDYNKELVKRGEMLIDLSLFESLTTPDAKPKRGRPYTYPKALIFLLLLLKFSLRLPYRQTEGLARKIFSSLGVAIPNFRTLHYRLTKEEINLEDLPQIENLQDDFVIVLDSTGLKVTNRGEWLRKKHGKRARRGWIKLHVAFDINSSSSYRKIFHRMRFRRQGDYKLPCEPQENIPRTYYVRILLIPTP